MPDAVPNRRSNQRPALYRVVQIIFQRIGNRFRDDDRSGKMHDRPDALFGGDPVD